MEKKVFRFALMDYTNSDLVAAGTLEDITNHLLINWLDELENGFDSTEDSDYQNLKKLVEDLKSANFNYDKMYKIFWDELDWTLEKRKQNVVRTS